MLFTHVPCSMQVEFYVNCALVALMGRVAGSTNAAHAGNNTANGTAETHGRGRNSRSGAQSAQSGQETDAASSPAAVAAAEQRTKVRAFAPGRVASQKTHSSNGDARNSSPNARNGTAATREAGGRAKRTSDSPAAQAVVTIAASVESAHAPADAADAESFVETAAAAAGTSAPNPNDASPVDASRELPGQLQECSGNATSSSKYLTLT